ncbi:uncharacterized protein LOC142983692 isoform X2 [Anticarsia gemmatalis]|uniref:uncharacterized protein LOC142983692 isoform X2 n=1 Tax=Anticarsia gemmatalis TaxID=129554 RepID=UPI003F75F00C
MHPIVLITVLIHFVLADQSLSKYDESGRTGVVENMSAMIPRNGTYIEKAENMIRFPTIDKNDEKSKKRFLKKSPKSTIQKIIKKNRQKMKKIFVVKMTSPTMSPEEYDAQEDLANARESNDFYTTMSSNLKKKSKKWNSRTAGYKMPFQKLQKMNIHRRDKRGVERDDLYILKDFNEMKFIKEGKDFSVVNAHVKKYW